MNEVITAVIMLCVLGLFCALLLVIAAKYMHVPVDEKFPAVRDCLPGANCGACGYAGCDGYASALVSGEETLTNKCVPGGADAAERLAKVMGTAFVAGVKKAAVVHCGGTCDVTGKLMDFKGTQTCSAAALLFGGNGKCAYGCIGLGDCAAACPEQAINVVSGVARVNSLRCTGCGICTGVCPKKIIMVQRTDAAVKVICSNKDKGPSVKQNCVVGCIGCGLCMRKCPVEAIRIIDNLSVIDDDKCIGCGSCREVCPAKCIH